MEMYLHRDKLEIERENKNLFMNFETNFVRDLKNIGKIQETSDALLLKIRVEFDGEFNFQLKNPFASSFRSVFMERGAIFVKIFYAA
jgi:hypothetical protein